ERERRRDVDAPGLSALVIVLIETDIEACANLMRALEDAQVVEKLWSRHPSRRARSIDERSIHIVEVAVITCGAGGGENIREIRICFALCEQEEETGKSDYEFVVDVRRELRAPPQGQILRRAKDFAERREAREDLRTPVERVTLPRILIRVKEAAEDGVS